MKTMLSNTMFTKLILNEFFEMNSIRIDAIVLFYCWKCIEGLKSERSETKAGRWVGVWGARAGRGARPRGWAPVGRYRIFLLTAFGVGQQQQQEDDVSGVARHGVPARLAHRRPAAGARPGGAPGRSGPWGARVRVREVVAGAGAQRRGPLCARGRRYCWRKGDMSRQLAADRGHTRAPTDRIDTPTPLVVRGTRANCER